MNLRKERHRGSNRRRVAGSVLMVGMLLLMACSSSSDSSASSVATGSFRSALTGTSSNGTIFRLRNAVFGIAGAEDRTVSSEDFLGEEAVVVDLAPGDYEVLLSGNWYLERALTSGGFTVIDADLQSEPRVPFTIAESQTTGVVYSFRWGDDIVVLGDGTLSIGVELDDTPMEQSNANCSDGADNDLDGAVDCADSECALTAVCAVCGDDVVSEGEICDGANIEGYTCDTFGYTGGTVICNGTCDNLDLSGCEGGTAGWTCDPTWIGDGMCDCGCGIMDTDCTDATAASCEYCSGAGSCNPSGAACPANIDETDNAICITPVCGDGYAEGMEACDGFDLRGNTCESMSPDLMGSGLLCNPLTCELDTTGCDARPQVCGDGVVSGAEVCEGPADVTYTCIDLGFTDGAIDCAATCDDLDLSGCAGGPMGWTCPAMYYGDGDCDCGCGIVDADCPDATAASCQFCGDIGACTDSNAECPANIDPANNAICI